MKTVDEIENTYLAYFNRVSIRSQAIYISMIVFVVIAMASLPLINVNVTVKGLGNIQGRSGVTELFAPASGRISWLKISDNQKVAKNDLLLKVDPATAPYQNAGLEGKLRQLTLLLSDINMILALGADLSGTSPLFRTEIYGANFKHFKAVLEYQEAACSIALTNLRKFEILHKSNAVSRSEFEQYKYAREQAVSSRLQLQTDFIKQLRSEQGKYRQEYDELRSQRQILKQQEILYDLKAPVEGTLQNLSGVAQGTIVYQHQKIGELSPSGTLQAVCFIRPADIGFIRINQTVKISVTSYDHHHWGSLEGKVSDISDDILVFKDEPFFKIRCAIVKNPLRLKNGAKAKLKRGMGITASFLIARRSLLQLLFDNVNDWLEPAGN